MGVGVALAQGEVRSTEGRNKASGQVLVFSAEDAIEQGGTGPRSTQGSGKEAVTSNAMVFSVCMQGGSEMGGRGRRYKTRPPRRRWEGSTREEGKGI
jgi:hypothetical protein